MLKWYYITRTEYDAIEIANKSEENLYYLSDTNEIYRGTQSFTQSIVMYDGTEPASKAVNRLYINNTTLEGKIWTGSSWTTVIQELGDIDVSNTTKPVSGKSVADYVVEQIAGVTGGAAIVKDIVFNNVTKNIVVTKGDDTTTNVLLDKFGVDLSYNPTTGALQLKDVSGTVIGTSINLDLERFVTEASYDAETHKIILKFNNSDTPLEIDVADLVDTYTVADSSTLDLTMTANAISGEVKVSATSGNMITASDDGLFVAATDISGKVDKFTGTVSDANKLVVIAADGKGIANSAKTIGGATVSASPDANTLATEAAVAAIRSALQTSIDSKMLKVGTGKENEIIMADAAGDAKASGVKIGTAEFNATPNASTVATEAGVAAYIPTKAVVKTDIVTSDNMASTIVEASENKVPSEKAMVSSLIWHIKA